MRKILLLLATATIASATPFAARAAESHSPIAQTSAARVIEPALIVGMPRATADQRRDSDPYPLPWAGLDLKWVCEPGSEMRTGPSDLIG
jgi:hypothetical protein